MSAGVGDVLLKDNALGGTETPRLCSGCSYLANRACAVDDIHSDVGSTPCGHLSFRSETNVSGSGQRVAEQVLSSVLADWACGFLIGVESQLKRRGGVTEGDFGVARRTSCRL